jgi:hypothetical protein
LSAPTPSIHEAGHAVVAFAFGHDVVLVTLFEAGSDAQQRLGVCRSNRDDDAMGCFEAAVVCLAGPMAEQAFAGHPRDVRAMMWGSSWKADRAKAGNHLSRSSMGRTLGDVALSAASLVTEHWPAIVRVAEALLAEGELSCADIGRLGCIGYNLDTRSRCSR